MSEIVFETERTRVRKWRDTDIEAVLSIYGDAEAIRWVDDGEPISISEAKRLLDVTRRNYEIRGYGMFAVELRGKPEVIGFCGIVHPDGQEQPENAASHRVLLKAGMLRGGLRKNSDGTQISGG